MQYDGLDITALASSVSNSGARITPAAFNNNNSKQQHVYFAAPGSASTTAAAVTTPRRESICSSTSSTGHHTGEAKGVSRMKLLDRRLSSGTAGRASASPVSPLEAAPTESPVAHATPATRHHRGSSGGRELASSRWRVFGMMQRPAPEWRRKPSQSVSNFQQQMRESEDGSDQNTVGGDAQSSPTVHAARRDTFCNSTAFDLSQSYRGGKLEESMRRASELNGRRPSRHRPSSASSNGPRVAPIIGVSEEDVRDRIARAVATCELECLEKYERALLECAEREATLTVTARHAVVERDAAQDRLKAKNKRIAELESLVESLAGRFLFHGGPSDSANALRHGVEGPVEYFEGKRQPVPVMVADTLPYESTRPTAQPRRPQQAEDSKLVVKLRDAIAAFERKLHR